MQRAPTAGVWIALGIIRAASVVALVALSPLFLVEWLTRRQD